MATAAGAAVLLVGCGGGASTAITPREVTVPVLWAGQNPDGSAAAGIEPATVAVGSEGDAGFTLNLDDVRAKKAGPAWQAATASAAAVGTLLTGADQSAVHLRYDITGAIDGPSGGGMLTVGTMAAITGAPLDPKVTMTGTISPDGTIGLVSQVPAKVRAARKAGYTTVLIPWGTRTEIDASTGRSVDVVALGRSLGVTVRTVRSVAEAYKAFTGTTVVPTPKVVPAITPAARRVAAGNTRRAVAALSTGFDAAASRLSAAQRAGVAAQVASARQALAAGRTALAYGLAVHGTYALNRAVRSAATAQRIGSKGVPAARAALLADTRALLARADTAIAAQSNPAGLTTGQRLALPMALGWEVQAKAVLTSFVTRLAPGAGWGARELPQAAAVLGDMDAAITRFGPDAVAVVRASPGRATAADDTTVTFLSGYTNFLVRAGQANRDYYVTVDYGAPDQPGLPNDVAPVLGAMSKIVAATPQDENALQDEIVQAANATTYYLLGAAVVSGRQFGMQGFGLGEDPPAARAPAVLASSVQQSSATVYWWASSLQPKGVNLSAPLWGRQWADALFAGSAGTGSSTGAGPVVLTQLWYSAATALVANSAEQHLGGGNG